MRRGLLFAGTERGVFVSFNDGDDWQSLQLNLPATSMRDLAVKDDDLIVATHGRGFWILDDITALRQIDDARPRRRRVPVQAGRRHQHAGAERAGHAAAEGRTVRREPAVRRDDRLLPEERVGGPVTIEILDAAGRDHPALLERRPDAAARSEHAQHPAHWVSAPEPLSAAAGMHRWIWDLRGGASAGRGGGRGARSCRRRTVVAEPVAAADAVALRSPNRARTLSS